MASVWDPAYVWEQCGKLFRHPDSSQVHVQEAVVTQDVQGAGSSLSSRDLMLISGAAAVGGALVVAAVYATPIIVQKCALQCPVCGCQCCACYVSRQHPVELVKKLLKGIASSLDASRERIQKAVGRPSKLEEQKTPDNNGSWTCIQVSRDSETSTTSVDIEQATDEGASSASQHEGKVELPDPYSPAKRKGYLSWDDYFMSIAFLSAQRSKDPVRQVGACLVSQDYVILGIGYNGFPRGCPDDKLPWAKKAKDGDMLKTKYPYVCHAEVNAILNKNHASAAGQRLYSTLFPCNECAKVIIQAGIAEVIFYTDKQTHPDFQFAASRKLLSMANVKMRQHQPSRLSWSFKA